MRHSFYILSAAACLLCAGSCPRSVAQAAPRAETSPAPALSWNADAQGRFVLAMAQDRQGGVWVGNEDGKGLWRYTPAAKQWINYPASADLPSDVYALCADRRGRVWAGTLNHGVSVFNGQGWKNYDAVTGPLGSRVFAIAACPTDGDIWIAADGGLARYSLAKDAWTYYTRADGLPSDQFSCLAFDKKGTLYAGTMCDGLAIASPQDGYTHWRTVTGWNPMPLSAGGDGLPSKLINAVLVSRSGAVYVGTTHGLAHSYDGGKTWRFLRGADWQEQGNGLYGAVPTISSDTKGHLLLEDYVTSLAEDGAGDLYIGYRSKGYEVINPDGDRLYPAPGFPASTDFVTTLLPFGDKMLVGRYGGGLLSADAEGVGKENSAIPESAPQELPFPSPAKQPTVADLQAMTKRVQALKGELPVGGAAYLGEDWQTEGDWVGHYGRQYARLFAIASPYDQIITWHNDYLVVAQMGPHHTADDALRHWISFSHTDNQNALYSPVDGFRTQAEIDDHGEAYAGRGFGGPDIWITITVPEGVHRVSLYFYNKDAHSWENSKRDYLVELKKFRDKPEDVERSPALASARVKDFAGGGVYQSFVVCGPRKYYVKISKNNSINTICSGVFIDRLLGTASPLDALPAPFMGRIRYEPLDTTSPDSLSSANNDRRKAAASLWSVLDATFGLPQGCSYQRIGRTFAYRAVIDSNIFDTGFENWRWGLNIWTDDDRGRFVNYMKAAHETLTETVARPISR